MTRLRLLGTTNWMSYALFRAGVRATNASGTHSAEQLYRRALNIDPNNAGARVNLAKILIEQQQPAFAVSLLRDVNADRLHHSLDDENEVFFYNALYHLALAYYNERRMDRAKHFSELLVVHAETRLRAARVAPAVCLFPERLSDAAPPPAPLQQFLVTLWPLAASFYIGLVAEGDKDVANLAALEAIDTAYAAPEVLYNLACTHALVAAVRFIDDGVTTNARQALRYLRRALQLAPQYAKHAATDRSLAFVRETPPYDAEFATLVNAMPYT